MAEIEKSKSLYQALWTSADELRSKMDPNEYKSYLLGLVFYKYLSDKLLNKVVRELEENAETLQDKLAVYLATWEDPDQSQDLVELLESELGYVIPPHLTFTYLVNQANIQKFQLEDLKEGFNKIEQSNEAFEDLFSDIDLNSRKLGPTVQRQNATIATIMKELESIQIPDHAGDILGDAYEYLIGQFASDSGKKAGEFYTPQAVSKLMTQIVIHGKEDKKGFTVYDPAMGSGSLLLNVKHYSNEPNTVEYYGQELNRSTYNLARMNMVLHDVPVENQKLHNADTLDQDWPTDEPTDFDGVLMNPPYSANWSADKGFLQDPRFSSFGVLAPKSKADFAFLLHGYHHLKQTTGVMAIVLPHGVLFRGNAEGKIRQRLLEEGAIDAVIGLPSNIFFNTGIPTTILILKKNRTTRDVLFIDASKKFEKGKNQNILTDDHIDEILQAYHARQSIDKFAALASYEQIVENDYNLNIPRYVDTFEEVPVVPLSEISAQLTQIDQEIEQTSTELRALFDQLVGTSPEEDKALKDFLANFQW